MARKAAKKKKVSGASSRGAKKKGRPKKAKPNKAKPKKASVKKRTVKRKAAKAITLRPVKKAKSAAASREVRNRGPVAEGNSCVRILKGDATGWCGTIVETNGSIATVEIQVVLGVLTVKVPLTDLEPCDECNNMPN